MARHRYQKRLDAYGPIYDCATRSIKRWIATGRAAGELPPLDEPPAMAGWWERRMRQRTPTTLLKFVTVEKKCALAEAEITGGDESGDDEALRQARANLRAAYAELQAARKPDETGKVDEATVARAHRVWNDAAATFQAAQRGADDTAKKRGELVSKPEILSSAADLAQQLRRIHETIARNVDTTLADLPEDTRARVKTAIEREIRIVHAAIRHLEANLTNEFELAAA